MPEMEEDLREVTLHNVYHNGRGCRSVPLILLYLRFIYIYNLVPLSWTFRGCLVPSIPPDRIQWFASQGVTFSDGYWAISVGGTVVSLHALYWIWIHHRHPAEGVYFD